MGAERETMKRVLIIADSHGADYGVCGYASRMKKKMRQTLDIDILKFGGVPIKKIRSQLCRTTYPQYDIVIFQIGNPDVHPRLPQGLLRVMRKIGGAVFRDSLFSVPPVLRWDYPLRLPLFLLRLVVIRFYREYYATDDEILSEFAKIIKKFRDNGAEFFIIPLFQVCPITYGKYHNDRVLRINSLLYSRWGRKVLHCTCLQEAHYRKCYNLDRFHFNDQYHEVLTEQLIKVMSFCKKTNKNEETKCNNEDGNSL